MARPPDTTWELFHNLRVHPSWGYVIYRTTYSSVSDAHFSTVFNYLEACIRKSFFAEAAEYASTGGDPAIYQGIWAQHSLTVIEDAMQLDGVSIDSIRARFEEWVDVQGQRDKFNKYRMCIVIDEECLQTLLGTSAEALDQETQYVRDKTVRYVKVVEAWPIIDEGDEDEFLGWMKCWSRALWDLWSMMGDGAEMSLSWDKISDFCPGVYRG
ncbi:uncharacterized protein N7515_001535 [Penicillium bovifimosum]|uniref:Uncharacterized protein n=1 Tax=Penicillium bovifimosum TaxID=126998 RepID=A0A9W9HBS1_9EURO|nr:uncharacterized protein N7515_001535 [Penicillium bovifimosum]KAJ5142748.1 hypothetical protein N7515_001535 [Penicillium bovifimosum]